jgi:hypothetical protein
MNRVNVHVIPDNQSVEVHHDPPAVLVGGAVQDVGVNSAAGIGCMVSKENLFQCV